ncbi:MAG: nucleoside triphosphate pyrophosphohydrolase [Pseudomonadota bacterium]
MKGAEAQTVPTIGTIDIAETVAGEKVRLAYARWQPENGAVGTVVAVHGLTRQKRDFDFIAETLVKEGYDVWAVDAPGRGESSRFADPQNYYNGVYADVFSTFLKQMKFPPVHWIGTSMGGLIALHMAAKGHTGLFRSLTLIDITHKPRRDGLDRVFGLITETLPVFTSIEHYTAGLKKHLLLGDVPEHVWRHYAEHQLRKTGDVYALHHDPLIARRALSELKKVYDLSEGVQKLTCPIALVAGGVSDLCTAEEIEGLKALKPEAIVHICPKAGHVPALDDAATQGFILDHLAKSSGRKHLPRLLDILEYLRTNPDGCAWTKAQTHKSLVPYLVEETYETADVIDQGKADEDLRDELGDILLQIAFHAQIASERGAFTFDDVAGAIVEKLERRYPTILGGEANTLKTPQEIDRRWEEIKAGERRKKGIRPDASILDEVSHGLPALLRAAKLKGRASREGWEWPDVSVLLGKINEEVGELRDEIEAKKIDREKVSAELGDLMFLLVDFARWYGFDAEDALRATNNRFERRFRYMEQGLKRIGRNFKTSTPEERMALWDEAKSLEKKKEEVA